MELTEKIETINRQLVDRYGIDTITGLPMWRVVWSENQLEKRLTEYTASGVYLLHPAVLEMPKYPWIKDKYVLERLVVIPEINAGDLPASKLSYEPMYPFQDNNGDYLPPRLDAAIFIIDSVLASQGKSSLAKYKDPLAGVSQEEYLEIKRKEIDILQLELFGNETDTGDAMAHGEAIIVPRSYKKES